MQMGRRGSLSYLYPIFIPAFETLEVKKFTNEEYDTNWADVFEFVFLMRNFAFVFLLEIINIRLIALGL